MQNQGGLFPASTNMSTYKSGIISHDARGTKEIKKEKVF